MTNNSQLTTHNKTPRIIEIQTPEEVLNEIKQIGADQVAQEIMQPKAVFRAVKVKAVSSTAANIIKQEMLSRGGEVVVARGVVNNSISASDILMLGTLRQFDELLIKMQAHQFGLPALAEEIKAALHNYSNIPAPIKIGEKEFVFGKRTYVVGVVNITPDSFSDGGKFSGSEDAIKYALKLVEDGADILDIGGESTRPGAQEISVEEEIKRVVPVIQGIRDKSSVPVSIDTRKSKVAKEAIAKGASMVNDISGLRFDSGMAKVVADHAVPVCLMHMRGIPLNMQENIHYDDLIQDVIDFLFESIAIAKNAGILGHKIIIDPGIGFGKTVEQNLEILGKLKEFKVLGYPIMVGTSRKSLIGKTLDLPIEHRLEGTAATVAVAIANGADFVRVHDVCQMGRVVKMTDAVLRKQSSFTKVTEDKEGKNG
ncbi:MAG: dihydropteroate synthase [Candidatus Saganbacteria bacterium]|nr:dihydropteroate synthase [Candidatus Saganbacteria bacterium]